MTKSYSRAEGGARVKAPKPFKSDEKYSMIGAISMFGIVAITYLQLSVNTEAFKTYVQKFLLPKLRPGKFVIMDNVKFHKNKEIIDLIESSGAKVIFLPPYSPDLSPIEKMWSKVKEVLKRLRPRKASDFFSSLAKAIHEVDQSDCEEWFESCGYIAA